MRVYKKRTIESIALLILLMSTFNNLTFAQNSKSSELDTIRSQMSYLKNKKTEEYIKQKQKLDRIISQQKINYSQEYRFNDAIRLIQEQKFDAAIYELNNLIEEGYNLSRCYELLGDICFNLRRPVQKTVQYYKNSLKYDNNVSVLYKLSKIYISRNKNILGLEYITNLINNTDDFSLLSEVENMIINLGTPQNKYEANNFYETLANVQMKLGKKDDSYKNYIKALQANPDDLFLKYYLTELLYDDNCPKDVIKLTDVILMQEKNDLQLKTTRAKALANNGEINSSYLQYIEILKQNPNSKQAKYGIYKLLENHLSLQDILAKINFSKKSYIPTISDYYKFAEFLEEFNDTNGANAYKELANKIEQEEKRKIELEREKERIKLEQIAAEKKKIEEEKQKQIQIKKQKEKQQIEQKQAQLKAQQEKAKLVQQQKQAQLKAQQEKIEKQKQEAKRKAELKAQQEKERQQKLAQEKQKQAELKAQQEKERQQKLAQEKQKQAELKAQQEKERQQKLAQEKQKQAELKAQQEKERQQKLAQEKQKQAELKAQQEKERKEKAEKEYEQRKIAQEVQNFKTKNPKKFAEYNALLDKYLKTEPKDSNTYLAIANTYKLIEAPTASIKYYKEAIKLAPTNADLYYSLALTYMELDSFETAYSYLNKSLSLEPENSKVKKILPFVKQKLVTRYINNAFAKFEQKKYFDSSLVLDEGIKAFPDSAQLYYYRALAYDAMNRNAAAIIDLQQAINLDSSFYMSFYQLGKSYEKIKDERNALVAYERFLSTEPEEKDLIEEVQKKVIDLGKKYY